MEKLEKNIGLIERILVISEKYKISTIFKSVFIIFIFSLTVFLVTNPTYLFDKYEEVKNKRHQEQMENVMKNNLVIQSEMENLLYKTGASRVILLQYHNTKNSLSGIPFIYLTATNECLASNTVPVSEGYEALKTSLYPFVNILSKEKYISGDISLIEKYDKALAYRMRGNDVTHFAACHIESDVPLGILIITYTSEVEPHHQCSGVETLIRNSTMKIGCLINNNHPKPTRY